MKNIKFVLSLIIIIATQTIKAQLLSVYPNPFSQIATIQFTITVSDTVSLVLIDILGQQVKTIQSDTLLQASNYSYSLNGDSLANGVYFIKLKSGTTSKTTRVTKQSSLSSNTDIVDINSTPLYPNPTKNKIFIPQFLCNSDITVIDISGKEMSITLQQNQIDLSDIPIGFYWIKFLNNSGTIFKKIIKE